MLYLFYENYIRNGGDSLTDVLTMQKANIKLKSKINTRLKANEQVEQDFNSLLLEKQINGDQATYDLKIPQDQDVLKSMENIDQAWNVAQEIIDNCGNDLDSALRVLNDICAAVQTLIDVSTSKGEVTKDSVTKIQEAHRDLNLMKEPKYWNDKTKEGDISKKIKSSIRGALNSAFGYGREIAIAVGLANANSLAAYEIINSGGTLNDVYTNLQIDDKLEAEAAQKKGHKKVLKKNDITIMATDDNVNITIMTPGISVKNSSKNKNSVTVHSTTLYATLKKAYDNDDKIFNLAAGLGSDSAYYSYLNPNSKSKYTNNFLLQAWRKIVKAAAKLNLVDWIAGSGEIGDSVQYLIVNDKVYLISDIFNYILKQINGLDDNDDNVNSLVKIPGINYGSLNYSRNNFINANVQAFQESNSDGSLIDEDISRSDLAYKNVYSKLTAAKINVSINLHTIGLK